MTKDEALKLPKPNSRIKMFYRQCNDCNERWELGTASTCICLEQEPVAWTWEKEDGYTSIETHSLNDEDMKNVGVKSIKPLYTTPQFIGLTEDEILSISADCASSHQHMDIHFARAIEAKLRSKNI